MLNEPSSTLTAVGVGLTLVYWWYRHWKNSLPKKWRRIGTLDQINIFPLHNCAPLELNHDAEVECDIFGLKLNGCRERALAMCDESGEIVSEDMYPRMDCIVTKLFGSLLEFSALGMKSITLDLSTLTSEEKQLQMMAQGTGRKMYFVGAEYDKWLSKFILDKDSGIRLVHYPIKEPQKPGIFKDVDHINKTEEGIFHDTVNFVLINLSTIDEINSRLIYSRKTIDPSLFHGNFYLKMDNYDPSAEGSWQWMKIGDDVIFRVMSDTEIDKLVKRDFPSTPLIVYLGLRAPGTVKKGAVVYVEDK